MDREKLAEIVVHTAETRGVFAAIRILSDQNEQGMYSEAMRLAYWNRRSLALALAIATAGVGRLLSEAANAESEEAYAARSATKVLLYDVASFSWPGWGEPDVSISSEQRHVGLAAAGSNLELAQLLDKGALAHSRAHWMLGAHLLTDNSYDEAVAAFTVATRFASDAGSDLDHGLCRAFAALSSLAGGEEDAADALDVALSNLEGLDDGETFVAQVTTCRDVLDISVR